MENQQDLKPKTIEIFQFIRTQAVDFSDSKSFEQPIKDLAEQIYVLYFQESNLDLVVDVGGHNKGLYDNRTLRDIKEKEEYQHISTRLEDVHKFSIRLCIEDYIKFKDGLHPHIDTEDKLLTYLNRNLYTLFQGVSINCYQCGQNSQVNINQDKLDLYTKYSYLSQMKGQKPCVFPNGVGVYSYPLDVPSGKLVFGNRLVTLLDKAIVDKGINEQYLFEKIGDHTLETSQYATKIQQEYWNDHKVAYIFTRNSSPSVFWNNNRQEIVIKSEYQYSFDIDRDDDQDEIKNYTSDEILKGKITTDLWAVCAMDYDYFVSLCEAAGKNIDKAIKELDAFIVDIPVGQYDIEYWGGLRDKTHKPHAVFRKNV